MDATLGERELDVMGELWRGGPGTVAEIRERLPVSLAYNTVLTILRNLEGKGFVRHEEEGKAHRYFPLVARQAAEQSAVTRLIDRLFHGSPELLLTRLVDDHALSPEQLKKYLFGAKMVRCDETAWAMWGISMAGWNAILSGALAFVLASGVASWVRERR